MRQLGQYFQWTAAICIVFYHFHPPSSYWKKKINKLIYQIANIEFWNNKQYIKPITKNWCRLCIQRSAWKVFVSTCRNWIWKDAPCNIYLKYQYIFISTNSSILTPITHISAVLSLYIQVPLHFLIPSLTPLLLPFSLNPLTTYIQLFKQLGSWIVEEKVTESSSKFQLNLF